MDTLKFDDARRGPPVAAVPQPRQDPLAEHSLHDALGEGLTDPLLALTHGPLQLKRASAGETPAGGGSSSPGPGGAIPYKSEMERSFGQDFSDVRSYTGRAGEMASLQAHAATDGRNVMFASGSPSRSVVAHEMAHVVQSRQAGASAVQTKPLVTDAATPAEREADAVADQVTRGERVTVREAPGARVSRSAYGKLGTVGRLQVDAKAESDYYDAAGQFEIGLGKELAQSSDAKDAASAMVQKVAKMVDAWGKKLGVDLDTQYKECFGKLDSGSSGYVMPIVDDIKDVIKKGNLREQLTLIYSAVRGGYLGKMLQVAYLDVMEKTKKTFTTKLEGQLDTEKTKGFAKDAGLAKHIGKSHDLFEDDKGNAKFDMNAPFDGYSKLFSRGDVITREENSGEKQSTGGSAPTGKQHTREKNIDLSERELRAQLAAQFGIVLSKSDAAKEAKKAKLPVEEYLKQQMVSTLNAKTGQKHDPKSIGLQLTWTPGETWYKAQVDGQLSEKARETKALLRASISGSTDMMMHASEYLGMNSTKDLKKVRLAMLAWMLPAKDHSFWEIMASAAQFGLNDFDPKAPKAYKAYETAISPASKGYNQRARDYIDNKLHPKKDVYPGYFLGDSSVKPTYKDTLAANWLPGSGMQIREGSDVDGWVAKGVPRGTVEVMKDDTFGLLAPLHTKIGKSLHGAMATGATDEATVQTVLLSQEYLALAAKIGDPSAKMITGALAKWWKPTADLGKGMNASASAADLMISQDAGVREKKHGLDKVDVKTHDELGKGKDQGTKDGVLARNREAFARDGLEMDPKAYKDNADKMTAWFEVMQRRGYGAFMSKVRFEQLQQLNDARKKAKGGDKEKETEKAFRDALDAEWQVTSLTEAEQTAIWQYTVSATANTTNEGIKGKDQGKLASRMTANQLLLSGLEKMKPYTAGPVYRGDGNRGFQPGAVVNYQEFVSTAKTVKSSFINHNSKDWCTHAVVIDKHKSGKDLMGFSAYSDATFNQIEGEVLFPPGSRFVVKRVVDWSMAVADVQLDNPSNAIKSDLKRKDQLSKALDTAPPEKVDAILKEITVIDDRIDKLHPGWKVQVQEAQKAAKAGGYSKQKLAKVWVYMDEV